ncbi:type II toxin-antitoxin system death-on-curing family toxin [Chengkuizengella sp. SCS-71B]|uniref:type II toxin-antitoxin system death-on-curing family toxin n=1 Tax=Chengkuizengella sp. SCS-71B TaxID=3115290 RepID=UPI0032C22ECF
MSNIEFLTIPEVIAVNELLINQYSPQEQVGIKDHTLLESAIFRPQHTLFGKDAYPSIFDKAAALFESLAKNHAFQNANKRTAFACLVLFLDYNGYDFLMNPKKAADLTVNMVNHKYNLNKIASIIKSHSKHRLDS